MNVRERLVLIATSDKWISDKYPIKHDDVLYLGRCDVRDELRKRGGAEGVICELPFLLRPFPGLLADGNSQTRQASTCPRSTSSRLWTACATRAR